MKFCTCFQKRVQKLISFLFSNEGWSESYGKNRKTSSTTMMVSYNKYGESLCHCFNMKQVNKPSAFTSR